AVNVTGRVAREPSGTVTVSFPEAMTAPSGWSRRAVQDRPTAVPVKSSLNTVMFRVTVLPAGYASTDWESGKAPVASDWPEADQYGRSIAATGLNAAWIRWICGLLHGSVRLSAP